MKKTLIALAVAASAAVSGSAMAWTANGTGGSVDLGGTLTPVEKVTPWEVKMGSEIKGLDASIGRGQKVVEVKMPKNALIMGIRTQTRDVFPGWASDITPFIDFNGAVNLDSFSNGVATLTLDVKQGGEKSVQCKHHLKVVRKHRSAAKEAMRINIHFLRPVWGMPSLVV